MKHIKDPIHGYIDVPDEELTILNQPEFQRLRRIRQLGLSSAVYPSATHTRFAHSLGVMDIAGELASSIGLSENEVRANQIAGLMHDIGHLPYSHTLESLYKRRNGVGHEKISCEMIDKIEKRETVDFPADKSTVKDIIRGDHGGTNVVANEIDADRLDYLLRDSYNTGIDLGQIEEATLIKFAEQINGKIGFNHKSLKSVEQLLDARMQMNYSVYSHDTVNITETMLERATEFHMNDIGTTLREFIGLGDDEFNTILTNSDSERAKEMFLSVRDRQLYKTCFLHSLHDISRKKLRDLSHKLNPSNEHERRIADLAGVKRESVLFSPPQYNHTSKFKTPIRSPTGEVRTLEEMSTKPESLRKSALHSQNVHIFCPKDKIQAVREATRDYFESIDETQFLL